MFTVLTVATSEFTLRCKMSAFGSTLVTPPPPLISERKVNSSDEKKCFQAPALTHYTHTNTHCHIWQQLTLMSGEPAGCAPEVNSAKITFLLTIKSLGQSGSIPLLISCYGPHHWKHLFNNANIQSDLQQFHLLKLSRESWWWWCWWLCMI